MFLFVANEFSGSLKQSNEGDLMWVDKNKLGELPMHEGDRHFLKCLQENKGIFSAKFNYNGGALKDYQIFYYN